MQYRQLGNTDMQVSTIGLGAAPLGNVYGHVDETDGIRAVHAAFDHGINFVDVSPYYGITVAETVLGKALRGVPRDRYYLTTKVGRYGMDAFDFSAEKVITSIDESCQRLGVETIDLILCHDIEFVSLDQIINETLPTLRRVQAQGKVRYVGVSGLPLTIFETIMAQAPIDVMLSYCHYALNDTTLSSLIPLARAKGVGVINASVLGMGLLTGRGVPEWHPASAEIRATCQKAADFCQAQGVDIAQLAVQFAFANLDIDTTLVGMAHTELVEKNVRWSQMPPDRDLLAAVQQILAPIKDQSWPSGLPENNAR